MSKKKSHKLNKIPADPNRNELLNHFGDFVPDDFIY